MCYIHCYWSARIDTICFFLSLHHRHHHFCRRCCCWYVYASFPSDDDSLQSLHVVGHESCTFWTVSFIIVWKMERTQNQTLYLRYIAIVCMRTLVCPEPVDFPIQTHTHISIHRIGGGWQIGWLMSMDKTTQREKIRSLETVSRALHSLAIHNTLTLRSRYIKIYWLFSVSSDCMAFYSILSHSAIRFAYYHSHRYNIFRVKYTTDSH